MTSTSDLHLGVGGSGSMDSTEDPKAVATTSKNLPCPVKEGKKRKSIVWDHFQKVEDCDPKKPRATCKYCGTEYACDPKNNGTSNMLVHINSKCKKYPYRKDDLAQKTLLMMSKKEGKELVPVSFSQDACREALSKMIILDELSFRIIAHEGFRHYTNILQPRFIIPSRTTVARDCLRIYLEEKKKLKNFMKGKIICITKDTWSSIQNLNYMCITAHFIDSDWNLQKRIISFCLVPNHKGDTIGKMVEQTLLDWGVDCLFTVTVDNASSNNGAIEYLKRRTKQWKGTILEHKYLHMRCCSHILNLIVCDGLKDVKDSIVKVRNAVRYVRSSPSRFAKFKKCVEIEKIGCKSFLCLDVPTRWNSTYMMLDAAEKFESAFNRLDDDDTYYRRYFENDKEGGRMGPPNMVDWRSIRVFTKFLKVFYNATVRLSGSLYVTSNAFFNELYLVQSKLIHFSNHDDGPLNSMAVKMQAKYDKYWDVEKINILLYVAMLLDPRYKMDYLLFCFKKLYHDSKAQELTSKVKDALISLHNCYVNQYSTSSVAMHIENENKMIIDDDEEDISALLASQYKKHLEEKDGLVNKSEVERFLLESCEVVVDKFEILVWWKNNSARYPILTLVAKDILAIPVSSVASESTFSTGGRVLDPFRSSLSPNTVEALICAQDWIRSSPTSINLRNSMDDLEQYDKIDGELFESASLSGSSHVDNVED